MPTLPIRLRETIRRDGTRVRSLLVFCPRQRASVAPDRCGRCGLQQSPQKAALAPEIECGVDAEGEGSGEPVDGLLLGPHAAATRIAAGEACARLVICLESRVPLRLARDAVDRRQYGVVFPVVNAAGVLVGTVPDSALANINARDVFATAADAMVPSSTVGQAEPLGDAIGAMTSHHLRHVVVVDVERRVVGTLSDLELLRWVARGAPVRWR
jgi:CBS domain-containing protein